MTQIRASWKRVVQVKPYETETLELSIEDHTELVSGHEAGLKQVEKLSRQLSALGDKLVAERMRVRDESGRQAVPTEPDPFLS